MIDLLIRWFLGSPASRSRTDDELARTFVFTHVFGPLTALPMPIYLYAVSDEVTRPLVVLTVLICAFWALPFLLRVARDMTLVSSLSFQMLTATSLFGTFHYGGFSSPFLPWLVISLLLGLFYLARYPRRVLTVFVANVTLFFAAVALLGLPRNVPLSELEVLGWLSIAAATLYMAWMALYYARLTGLRSELEVEVARSRATWCELERARAEAVATGQARARFFSRMSHELRTPLNAIIGYSDILRDECAATGARPERARDVDRINAAGKHLLALVADVLDTDRMETEALEVEVAPLRLGDLADDLVAAARPLAERGGNRLVAVCPRRGYELATDGARLRQILLHLLSNAARFTSHGVIRLELYVESRLGEDELHVVVSDTGAGISAAALPTLFQDAAGATAGEGESRLARMRRLGVLLGGELAVSSTPGKGSAFTVRVPAQLTLRGETDGAEDRAAAPEAGEVPGRARREGRAALLRHASA